MTPSVIFVAVLLVCVASLSSVHGQGCGCPLNQRGRRALSAPRAINNTFVNDKNETVVIVGDMLLGKAARDFMDKPLNKFRAASTLASHRWPNGLLRYYVPPAFDAKPIDAALANLARVTNNCVRFEKLSRPSGDYVEIYNAGPGICHAYLGRKGGRQELSLGDRCWGQETITHEFIHALGFYHEHQRPDRDQHLFIDWDNVSTSYCHAYAICQNCRPITQYNIRSIMQYPTEGFGCRGNNNVMFERRNRAKIPRNYLVTPLDVQNIKTFYGCR